MSLAHLGSFILSSYHCINPNVRIAVMQHATIFSIIRDKKMQKRCYDVFSQNIYVDIF